MTAQVATPIAEQFVVPGPAHGGTAPLRFVPLTQATFAAWDHIAFVLSGDIDDEDAAAHIAALIAYAWRQHGGGQPLPDSPDSPPVFSWPRPNTIVAALPMWSRPSKRRTPEQATIQLIATVQDFCHGGTPVRRDGSRLIEKATVAVCWALLGNSRRP